MPRQFHDGRKDGLQPLESPDPEHVHSFSDLLRAMQKTAFAGRQIGEAFDVMQDMVSDPDCLVVATLSGAMTVAKMSTLLCRMIEHGMINVIIATGALITHGLTESLGLVHYRLPHNASDAELYAKGYNRVYDTVEMEANLYEVEEVVHRALDQLDPHGIWSSASVTRTIGRILHEEYDGEGVLKSAYCRGVPVYIPAFTDSEMGMDLSFWAMRRAIREGSVVNNGDHHLRLSDLLTQLPPFNPYRDLQCYAHDIVRAPRTGIFTIGGGVPRNWAQQVGPYVDFMAERLGIKERVPRFHYGVRLCPEPAHWGGLSGSTYSEGISWGKFVPPADGGRFAEVYADATVVLPLLVQGLMECQQTSPTPRKCFNTPPS